MSDLASSDVHAIGADFLRMLSLVHAQFVLASEALLDGRIEHVAELRALDRRVDELEHDLEERCLRAMAGDAADPALAALIFRSLADLERAGDYAVHVGDAARLLAIDPPLKRYTDLRRIITTVKTMLALTARAYTERDAAMASSATRLDDTIDEQHDQFYRELLVYMHEHPRAINEGLALLRVGRSLQRIGDHVENVAERIERWLRSEPLSSSS